MKLNRRVEEIKKAIKSNGGTIQDDKLINLTSGYMVGIGNVNIIDMDKLQGLDNQINQILAVVDNQNITTYGLWVDNNLIYIDKVVCIEDKATALKIAKENKELAIWDNKKQEEITL